MDDAKASSEKSNKPKVEEGKPTFEVEPGLMSLEELDSIIEKSDPEALKNLESVREIKEAETSPTLELLQLDDYLSESNAHKLRKLIRKFKTKSTIFWIWAKTQSVESGKNFATLSKEFFKQKKEVLSQGIATFKQWPLKTKVSFAGAVVLAISTIAFTYFAFVKKVFNSHDELFIRSLLSWSERTWDLTSENTIETFYNTSRIPKNIFQLKRMVVNIQPSATSGTNPMAAYEFSLEGNSTEVLVEIKDREGEILDRVQRTIEEHTYDELNTPEGKKMISEKVRSTINRLLTLGKIRYVYIQGVILKP